MDAMVSARIGVEKRDRGNEILKRIGSTPTRLINAAYDYLLETGELPASRQVVDRPRALSEEELDELRKSVAATTFQVDPAYFDGKSDRDLLREALGEKHGMTGGL